MIMTWGIRQNVIYFIAQLIMNLILHICSYN